MKRQLILSLVIVFTLALFAPAVVSAMDKATTVEVIDNKEKKETPKAEKKAEATTEKKADCSAAKAAGCSEAKSSCCSKAETKTESSTKKEVKK